MPDAASRGRADELLQRAARWARIVAATHDPAWAAEMDQRRTALRHEWAGFGAHERSAAIGHALAVLEIMTLVEADRPLDEALEEAVALAPELGTEPV